MRKRCPLVIIPILLATLAGTASATEAGARLADQVRARVEQSFCWRAKLDELWPAAELERLRARALAAPDEDADLAVANELLAKLGASHAQVMPLTVFRQQFTPEQDGKETVRFGFEIAPRPGPAGTTRYFLTTVLPGGPAALAGLARGDEVVMVDGASPERSARTCPFGDAGVSTAAHLLVRGTDPVTLSLRTHEGGEPFPVRLEAAPWSRLKASRHSVRTFVRGGRRIGYLRLYHLLHPQALRIVEEAFEGPLKDVEGLVLDLRGWGGRTDVLGRLLQRLPGGRRPAFSGSIVALIDEHTRSAKEVCAFVLARRDIPLVGRRTAGAVLACGFFKLGDDHVMMLPVQDVSRLTDGVQLEGRGVAPTVEVRDDLPYAAGRDAILETGLGTLLLRLYAPQLEEPTLF